MSTRDKGYLSFTDKSTQIISLLAISLNPIFKEAMELGLSVEDFCYLVYHEAYDISLRYIVQKKHESIQKRK